MPYAQSNVASIVAVLSCALLLLLATPASAQVSLGSAQPFGVLGGTTVTNTGNSVITGEVGVWPGTSITGFPPGIATALHPGDAVAQQAQSDLTIAYDAAAGTACTTNLTGQDLGGLTLTPGVYCFDSSAFLTGTLTLDFQGNANAFFLFKTVSTLITAPNSTVAMINDGGTTCPENLFWQVGSSATLDTNTTFLGNILALTSIGLNTGANLNGRALARNGGVTLDTNNVVACGPLIPCPVITLSPATLPGATVGVFYNATIVASGGTAPYTYTVTSGSLPAGLTLNPVTGSISGTLTASATSNFTITATDAVGCLGSRAYSIVVGAALPPGAAGVPTLDFVGLAVLFVLLAGAGLFVMSRF
ncbi:MAG TPA: ice-binding family protein [Thermoanaerobaculia bacterium]|nr:ice-binding family protein [Thermoanaerobaculia bacterium]